MTWFAIHDSATGELKSIADVVADPLPPGLTAKPLAGRPDLAVEEWNEAGRVFQPKPPAPAPKRPALRLKDSNSWTLADVADWLKEG